MFYTKTTHTRARRQSRIYISFCACKSAIIICLILRVRILSIAIYNINVYLIRFFSLFSYI